MKIIYSEKVNEIYNVSGGFEQNNLETVNKIIKEYGNLDSSHWIDFSYTREGQDVRYALNDSKLRALGWEPKKIFDQELPAIVENYKGNFKW